VLRVAVALLITLAGFVLLQDRWLYFPDRAALDEVVSARLQPWPTAEAFRGLVAEPAGPVRATAIVFHGNAGHAGHRAYYASALHGLGLRVILAEYPGYGPRDGALGESSLVADAERSIVAAHDLYGAPLLLIGESLGAAVAAAATARRPGLVAGLLLLTPWDRLESVARFHYPMLPVQWLLRDRYDSVAGLASFDRPILVVVAAGDQIVPARFGIALHQGLPGPKRLAVIEGADHNDWFDRVDKAWWREAIAFLLGVTR